MNKNYDLLVNNNNYAVVGINPDTEKYAHRIYSLLKTKGKRVYGVNKKYDIIDQDKVYASVLDIPDSIDIVVMVVNPTIGYSMLEDIKSKGIKVLWLQPGTISDELLKKASSLGMEVVQDCVLKQYHDNQ